MEAKYIDLDRLQKWGLTVSTLALKLDTLVCEQVAKGNNAMYIDWARHNKELPDTLKPLRTLPHLAIIAIAEAFNAKGVSMQIHYMSKELTFTW